MLTFEDYLKETDSYTWPTEELNETIHTSSHKRTPTEMSVVHKKVLAANGHTVVNHETTGNGSHVIHHITPAKKVRVTTIKPIHKGPNKSEIHDRPGTPEEHAKYIKH